MIGKIALLKKEITSIQSPNSTSHKEGDIKKCPSCGSQIQSFATKCKDCGLEFRNIDSSNTINQFYKMYCNIDIEERERSNGMKDHWSTPGLIKIQVNQSIVNRQSSLITSFPIPNSKEDIIEFLLMAIPEATKKLTWAAHISGSIDAHTKTLKTAWLAKCEQVIFKARFAMREDKKNLEEIEHYAKKLEIK